MRHKHIAVIIISYRITYDSMLSLWEINHEFIIESLIITIATYKKYYSTNDELSTNGLFIYYICK